jgi:predicted class III extradiol MEMO1 family dioxygenase
LQQREPQRVRRDFDRKNRKILDNMLHMQYKKRAVLLRTARKTLFGILTICIKLYMESLRKRARFSPARRPGSSSH